MALVTIKLGKTYNLGNYESLRVDVGISKDIKDDEKDQLYNEVLELMIDTAKKIKVE